MRPQRPRTVQDWNDPEWARYFEGNHSGGNPARAAHVELLLDALELAEPGWVLDLGCGPGLIAELLLERFPDTRLCGLDASQPMLALAAGRLARFGDRARLVRCDLARLDGVEVPDGCSAAIAVQSLHHIGREQAGVFGWLRDRLRPGGWLGLVERVAIPGPRLYEPFQRAKERMGMERNPAIWDGYRSDLELNGDHPLEVPELLAMLSRAGFDAGCLDVRADRAFILARRPEGRL